ncbi:MAG: hypothetical protein Q4C21_02700 [Oscillospiraceae bacterium]|nr:hypothetical protein [Oscillospiraceae bacterium]
MKKLKGSLKSVKMKYLLFMYAASLFILLPLRVYQLLAATERLTGFFVIGDKTGYVIYGLILLFVVLFLALSFLSREVPSPRLKSGKNMPLGIAALIFAAGLLYDVSMFVVKVYPAGASGSVFFSALKMNIINGTPIFNIPKMLLAVITIIWLVLFAVGNFGGKFDYKRYKIIALAPVFWAVIRTMSYLTDAINYFNVSEVLFEIAANAFLVLFFLAEARISTGVFSVDSMWGIYGYGFSAAVFISLITVPRIVVTVLNRRNPISFSFEPVDFGALVFVLTYIFASFGIGFDGSAKERKLISEIALPEDGAVVRKGDNRRLSETAENSAAVAEAPETHGIFKVEEETFEIAREEEPNEAVTLETDAESDDFGELSENEIPEETEEITGEAEEDVSDSESGFEESGSADEPEEAEESKGTEASITDEEVYAENEDGEEGASLISDENVDGGEENAVSKSFDGADESNEEYSDVESSDADITDEPDLSGDSADETDGDFFGDGESFFADSGEDEEESGEADESDESENSEDSDDISEEADGSFDEETDEEMKADEYGSDSEETAQTEADKEYESENTFEETEITDFGGDSEEMPENKKKRKKRGGFFKRKKEEDDSDEEQISAVSLKDMKAKKKQ